MAEPLSVLARNWWVLYLLKRAQVFRVSKYCVLTHCHLNLEEEFAAIRC
jgi:hypothetical protein